MDLTSDGKPDYVLISRYAHGTGLLLQDIATWDDQLNPIRILNPLEYVEHALQINKLSNGNWFLRLENETVELPGKNIGPELSVSDTILTYKINNNQLVAKMALMTMGPGYPVFPVEIEVSYRYSGGQLIPVAKKLTIT